METEKTRRKSEESYNRLRLEREKAEAAARVEAQRIIDEARSTANQVYEELKALRKQMRDAADVQGTNARQAELRRTLNEAEQKLVVQKKAETRAQPSREIRVGDTVELLKIGTKASVLAINKDGSYQLQAGILKVNAKKDEIYLLENESQKEVKKYLERTKRELRNTAAAPELDLRGMDAAEACSVLSIFLDNAMMANLSSVRIIHGKGTGVLRRAVQEELKHNKYVKKFRLGVYGEGEDGVTIAEF